MKKFIIYLVLIMKLASAMDIKEFAEKYHENFATREEEEKAAKVLAKSDAQIELKMHYMQQDWPISMKVSYTYQNLLIQCQQ